MTSAADKITDLGSNRYSSLPEEQKRCIAVAAALGLITASVSGADDRALLTVEMDKLSKYADQIQEALKVK